MKILGKPRIAITTDGLLQNVYFTGHTENPLERAFFKGVVTKVLPGIQTAFVDIGQEKAGFLHISEIDRDLAIEKISKHSPNLMMKKLLLPASAVNKLISARYSRKAIRFWCR